MKVIGSNALGKLLVLICVMLASTVAIAELNASVDRDRVAMGDTVRLTITATANEAINNVDLRPLLQDFEILQRSSSSSTNIINGVRTNTRQVIIDISPKREGTVRVPALQVGRDQTNYLLLAVAAATTAAGDPLISFEAELDSSEVYVQGQAILTLRIQQAVNLDSRSITDLKLDNAFVKALEQKSFQRTIAGRPWLVHEIRYAIFPEQSGSIEIPAQTFSARESQPRRSLFDIGSSGRQVKRSTEALRLKVLPRPKAFVAPTWLPARKLEITENWSTPPEQLRVGESATRRITITGEGLQGAQLPPILFPATTGLKYYPDQPVINDTEVASGLAGTRIDSAAVVPTRQGSWEVPEVRIPWWDTRAGKVRFAVIPARTILVAAALDDAAPLNIPVPALAAPNFDNAPIAVATDSSQADSVPWMIVAALSSLGWILTLAYLFARRSVAVVKVSPQRDNPSEAAAFKQLLAACATANALQARQRLIQWAATVTPEQSIHSLDQLETRFAEPELRHELKKINDSLYSPQGETWDGSQLTSLAKKLRKEVSAAGQSGQPELKLYPQQA